MERMKPKSSPQSGAEFRCTRHCTSISLTPSQHGGGLSTRTININSCGHDVDWNACVWSSAGKCALTLTNTDIY